MARIVCLANSYKEGGRCIAGIDIDTSEWVRPVSNQAGGTLPTDDVSSISILDVVEVSLGGDAPDEGCQPENRLVCGKWKKISKMEPKDLLDYCEDNRVILHNFEKSIPIEYFRTLPRERWKSLQLVHQTNITFEYKVWPERREYKTCLRLNDGKPLYLSITDPNIRCRLDNNEKISKNCIITVSLATPWEKDNKCYKVVAGVIEL
jgi:putative nucleic acid modification protein with dual OB domain